MTIDSSFAKVLLENNNINRKSKPAKATFIARQIERGLFSLNGESIIVSNKGELLDGQHRLMAVEMTNIPIVVVFVEGISSGAMTTIDTGSQEVLEMFYL